MGIRTQSIILMIIIALQGASACESDCTGGDCGPAQSYQEEKEKILNLFSDGKSCLEPGDPWIGGDDCLKNTGTILCVFGWDGAQYTITNLKPAKDMLNCSVDSDCVLSACEGTVASTNIQISCVKLCPIVVNVSSTNFCVQRLNEGSYTMLDEFCHIPTKQECSFDNGIGSECYNGAQQCTETVSVCKYKGARCAEGTCVGVE